MAFARTRMQEVQKIAQRAWARKGDTTRHKCFVSYHVDDADEVTAFVDAFGEEFIPYSLGVTDDDDFVDSTDDETIKRQIRELYLSTTTVTIVLLGACTWARRFVDWEISSSLRDDSVNHRSGLLVMPLPSMNNSAHLPNRVADNWVKGDEASSYASYRSYPTSASSLRDAIDTAFTARSTKGHLVNNARALRKLNAPC